MVKRVKIALVFDHCSSPVHDVIHAVAKAIGSKVYRPASERELQDGLARVLTETFGADVAREVVLTAQDRPDFMVRRVAVEVKTQGSLSALTRQIHRYAHLPAVDGVLVVSTLRRLSNLPRTINGKPVAVVIAGGAL